MCRLIDEDALTADHFVPSTSANSPCQLYVSMEQIQKQPTIDAVQVVRCRDCEHSYEDLYGRVCAYGRCMNCDVPDDWFCKDGERRWQE